MYFKQFPKTNYNFKSLGLESVELVDIFRRVAFNFQPYTLTKRPTVPYILKEGDTADIVAQKVYGNSEYWWLVLLYNNIINPFNSFPRSSKDYDPIGNGVTVIHIEKKGEASHAGHSTRDIRVGDIIIRTTKTQSETFSKNGINYTNVPRPDQDDDGNFKMAKVVAWDPNLRLAMIVGKDKDSFIKYTGSGDGGYFVFVMGSYDPHKPHNYKSREDNSYPVFFGTVRKVSTWDKRLLGFVDSKTGNPVSPLTNITTGKINSSIWKSSDQIVSGDPPKLIPSTIDYTNTIIGGYLGMDNGGTTWEDKYSADISTSGDITATHTRGLQSLSLLSDRYKEEAYTLFKQSLTSEKYSINELSTMSKTFRNTPLRNSNIVR